MLHSHNIRAGCATSPVCFGNFYIVYLTAKSVITFAHFAVKNKVVVCYDDVCRIKMSGLFFKLQFKKKTSWSLNIDLNSMKVNLL